MRVFKAWIFACSLVLITAQAGMTAGFGIYEWSARGNALGGAMVGRADDPSALASNPAGITQLEGVQVMAGVTAIQPVMEVNAGGNWASTDNDALYLPPHFFATWQTGDRYTIGLGAFTRFGLGTKFDETWAGRYNSYDAEVQSLTINPNVAVKVTDKLSAAIGVDVTWLDFAQKRKFMAPGVLNGDAALQADGTGFGFDMALHYKPCSYAKLGVVYRSPVEVKLTGDANFSDVTNATLPTSGLFNDTSASGKITLPDSLAFGVAIYPMDKLSVEVGAVYTWWSKYDKLAIEYGDNPQVAGFAPGTITTKKNWDDVWRFNLGAEYALYDFLDLRAGYVYDQSPVPDDTIDYMLPTNDRHLFNLGLGFHQNNWTVDVAYTYLMILDRDIDARPNTNGTPNILAGETNNADAQMVALSVGYKF